MKEAAAAIAKLADAVAQGQQDEVKNQGVALGAAMGQLVALKGTWTKVRAKVVAAGKGEGEGNMEIVEEWVKTKAEGALKATMEPWLPFMHVGDKAQGGAQGAQGGGSLKDFGLKVTLPTYDGKRNGCSAWWRRMERTLNRTTVGEDQWFQVVQGALTGAAAKKFWNLAEKKNDAGQERTVREVVDEMKKAYDTHSVDKLLDEWQELQQGKGEDAEDFQDRFTDLVEDVREAGGDTQVPADKDFVSAMRRKMVHRTQLELLHHTTVAAMVADSQLMEAEARKQGAVQALGDGRAFTGKCYNCGKTGHRASACNKPKRTGGKPPYGSCVLCKSTEHWKRDCPAANQAGTGGTADEKKHADKGFVGPIQGRAQAGEGHLAMCHVELYNGHGQRVGGRMFGDTGATMDNFITPHEVRRLGLWDKVVTESKGHAAAGGGVTSDQSVELTVRVGGKAGVDKLVRCCLMELPFPILLGLTTMAEWGAVLDLDAGEFEFRRLGLRVPMILRKEWQRQHTGTGQVGEHQLGQALVVGEPVDYSDMPELVHGDGDDDDDDEGDDDDGKMPGLLDEVREMEAQEDDDMSEEEGQRALEDLLAEYPELFGPMVGSKLKPLILEMKEGYKGRTINVPPARHSREAEDEIERQTQALKAAGLVERSTSKHNLQIVLSEKPNGQKRMNLNCVPLNKGLVDFSYPLPKIADLLDKLGRIRARYYSAMDLQQSFNQKPAEEGSREYLAYTSKSGKHQFTCMPFGVKISSELFQEDMVDTLSRDGGSEVLWAYVMIYIDDVVVATRTRRAHLTLLRHVFEQLRQTRLRLQRPKCSFMQPQIQYVGHVVDEHKVAPVQERLDCIAKVPTPTNKKELQAFLGMTMWHLKKYVVDYAKAAAPLWALTSTARQWEWTDEHDQAFEAIKAMGTKQLSNTHYDDDKPVELWTDWSPKAIAAVLMQEGKMVHCASRSLNQAEKNYAAVEGEMLALTYGLKKFRPYLLGKDVEVVTHVDHKPLEGVIMNDEQANKRLARLKAKTAGFKLKVVAGPGSDMKADFWTRAGVESDHRDFGEVVDSDDEDGHEDVDLEAGKLLTLTSKQDNREVLHTSYDRLTMDDQNELDTYDDGHKWQTALGTMVLVRGHWRLYVPKVERRALMWRHHRYRHHGVQGMMEAMATVHWRGKQGDITDLVHSCSCAVAKEGQPVKSGPSGLHLTASKPMELVAIDIFGYNDVDWLTKMDMCSAIPFVTRLPNGHTQVEVKGAWDAWVAIMGEPDEILADNGHEFDLIDLPRRRTAVEHPQSNGKLERFHKELANLCRIHGVEPDRALQYYITPAMRDAFWGGIRRAAEEKAAQIEEGKGAARHFAQGDLVLRFASRRSRRKADNTYTGLRKVVKVISDTTYEVAKGITEAGNAKVHVDQLKRYTMPESGGWRVAKVANLHTSMGMHKEQLAGEATLQEAMDSKWAGTHRDLGVVFHGGDKVWDKYLAEQPAQLMVVVPELPFEEWYHKMQQAKGAQWRQVSDAHIMDARGRPVGTFPFKLWAVKLVGGQ